MNITREDKDQLNSVIKIKIEKNDYSPKVDKLLKTIVRQQVFLVSEKEWSLWV